MSAVRRQRRVDPDERGTPLVAVRAIELTEASAFVTAPAELNALARTADTTGGGITALGLGRGWLLGVLDERPDDLVALVALGLVTRASAEGW